MGDRGIRLIAKDVRALAKTSRRVKGTPYDLAGERGQLVGGGESSPDLFATVVNNTGDDLDAFSVVRLERSITKTEQGEDDFPLKDYVWNVTAPNSGLTGTYGVTQALIGDGESGLALVVGVTKVKLDDTDEGDYASPIEDDMTKMETGSEGKYLVLGVDEAGSADTWGYVLLSAIPAPSSTVEYLWAKFDGVRTTKRYTGHLWTGTAGAAIQWIFSPDDPGVDDLVAANEYVEVYPAPAWIASNAAFTTLATDITVTGANWTNSSKTLTLAGAFTDYVWESGDKITLTAGTGVTLGEYTISSRTSDNAIVLATDINGAGGDISDNSINGTILGKGRYVARLPLWAALA